ncbi:MAG TPA: hypothetical protein VGD88_13475 [Opitutaceae bacterium]
MESKLARFLCTASGEERFLALATELQAWAKWDPAGAHQWIRLHIADDHLASQLYAKVIEVWVSDDVGAAANSLLVDADSPKSDAPLAAIARHLRMSAPAQAELFASLISDEALRLHVYRELAVFARASSEAAP